MSAEGKDVSDDALCRITSTLTSQQQHAVKRRVDTLRATLRSRPKEKTDVRDVFGVERNGAASQVGGGEFAETS